jgi:hypothetical protein
VSVVHASASTFALSRTVRSEPHVVQRARMLLRRVRRTKRAATGGQPLAIVAWPAPSTTTVSKGSAVPGMSGGATRKRTSVQNGGAMAAAGAAAARTAAVIHTAKHASAVAPLTVSGPTCAGHRAIEAGRPGSGLLRTAVGSKVANPAPPPGLGSSTPGVDASVHRVVPQVAASNPRKSVGCYSGQIGKHVPGPPTVLEQVAGVGATQAKPGGHEPSKEQAPVGATFVLTQTWATSPQWMPVQN